MDLKQLLRFNASYFLQSRWTFRIRPRRQYRWYVASMVTLSLAAGLGHLADRYIPTSPFAWIIVVVPITVASYALMRLWVFPSVPVASATAEHDLSS
jgi:putative flippase GtrA